jgi:rRNA maturation protein Rpf1
LKGSETQLLGVTKVIAVFSEILSERCSESVRKSSKSSSEQYSERDLKQLEKSFRIVRKHFLSISQNLGAEMNSKPSKKLF